MAEEAADHKMNQELGINENKNKSPEGGKNTLVEAYNAWSAGLGSYSVQAAYAIIAANWAVHAKTESILLNCYSTWSMGICVGFISVNILLVWFITELHNCRINKAMTSPEWWQREYDKRAKTRWPYTWAIETLSLWLRIIKGFAPISAGLFFILSLK